MILCDKEGGIKYHFLSLWYDSTWDWTLVSQTIVNTLLIWPILSSSFDVYKATSVTEVEMIINLLVWYSHNILPMKTEKSKQTLDSDDKSKCHDQQVPFSYATWVGDLKGIV